MSERGYFDLRYAVPGYTFILLLIVFNAFPIVYLAGETGTPEIFGAIFAFTYLLTGSAAGFVVSQFWWWRFHKKGGVLGIKEFAAEARILEEELELNLPNNEEQRKIVEEAFLDLTVFFEKEDKLLRLVWRRWDIYHTLSSVLYALGLGSVVGIICRAFIELSVYNPSFNFRIYAINTENVALVLMFIVVVCLLFLFKSARQRVIERYYPLHEALVRRSLSKNMFELSKAFPKLFHRNQQKNSLQDSSS